MIKKIKYRKPTKTSARMPKALDVFKEWLKNNFKKGDMLKVDSSPTVFVVTKPVLDFQFSYKISKRKNKIK